MKVFFTSISLLFLSFNISAQDVSNGGFETWLSGDPQYWSTSHSCIASSTHETQSTEFFQGGSSIKLVGGMLPAPASMSYPGFVHYGSAIYDNSTQDFTLFGVAFHARPDSLQFAYKYTPSFADSGTAFCTFYKGSIGNIIGIVNQSIYSSSTYKVITVPVTYNNSQVPDSINLTFYSGDLLMPHANSTLYVDAVKFIYKNNGGGENTSTGIEINVPVEAIKVFPNPASARINFMMGDNMLGGVIRIYNLLGKELISSEVGNNQETIDISPLEEGIYLYRIADKNDKIILAGKFNKEK